MITHTGKFHSLLFPSLVWRMPSEKIFLTFDDGPHETATPIVLDVLRQEEMKATFFLTGKNIPGRESIVARIAEEGHAIGVHSYFHKRSSAFSKETTKKEIEDTLTLLSQITTIPIRLFRPPFGFFSMNTIKAARELGMYLIMWSCLTGDFRNWSTSKIVNTALHKLHGGSIQVFHDNDLTQSKIGDVLPQTIAAIRSRGFEFGAIR